MTFSSIRLTAATTVRRFLLCSAVLLGIGTGWSTMPAHAASQIETRYFTIIYEENGEYTAGKIALFCDDMYESLLAQYDAFSDNPKVVCLVNDAVDLANGSASYFQNTITIYATSMDFELRGSSDWLKNVFVHEMTHMVALQKAAKGPINFMVLGGGIFDKNPDLSIEAALYHLSQPAWFSEGTAQVGAEHFGSEHWDSHRDMLLRAAWYENGLLTWDEMSTLSGQDGIDSELVYNQGYSLSRYIVDTYGYEALVAMNNSPALFDFDPIVKDAVGISADQLYADWLKSLDTGYASFREREFVEGEKLADEGSVDYYPVVSPDGRWLAWLSNRDRDYQLMDLMVRNLESGETRCLVKDVDYRPNWSHDSQRLVYVKRPPARGNFYDIYSCDVATGSERRLSRQMRAKDPSFSPGDSLIVFVQNEGGNNALAVINANGTGLRYLSTTHDGTQFNKPSFTPDGSRVVFGIYRQGLDHDIASISAGASSYRYTWDVADSTSGFADSTAFAENADLRLLLGSSADERDPFVMTDGSILYTTDRGGVYDIHRLNPATGRTTRLTALYGGGFAPSAHGGQVFYTGYHDGDFSIFSIDAGSSLERLAAIAEDRDYMMQPPAFDISGNFDVQPVSTHRILDAIVPTVNIGPSFIGSDFGLRVVDVGAEAYVSDLLGQDTIVAGGSVGKNFDEDVSLNSNIAFQYQRRMLPVTSSGYSHSPLFFVGGSRSVIHNNIKQLDGEADSTFIADIPDYGYSDVLFALRQSMTVHDVYRHEFRTIGAGVQIPLRSGHYFTVEAGYRSYYESLQRRQRITDLSTYVENGVDITGDLPGTGNTLTDNIDFFTDLNFFSSKDLSFSYNYIDSEPAADDDIAPKGTAALLRFRYMRTALADTLVEQPAFYVPIGAYMDGSFAISTYSPDPLADEFRANILREDVNEYMAFIQHNRRLPWLRHGIDAMLFSAYKDVYLKDYRKNEGYGFNWPLKYYMGGASMLSGYPYFSFWGSKIMYGRFDYVFPIKGHIFKNYGGMHLQRLYGSVFFEAGAVWNFDRLSTDHLREATIKRDVGVELRLKTVMFYRLPALLTARVAWPLDDMGDSPYRDKRDPRRFYFMLRM